MKKSITLAAVTLLTASALACSSPAGTSGTVPVTGAAETNAPSNETEPGTPKEASKAIALTEENIPQVDKTRGMILPLNGYLSQEIKVGNTTRTVKLYIGKDAPVRCYMTWVNVPDNTDPYEFLKETGWADYADEKKEGIFLLEPGEGGWGSPDEEAEYLNAAFEAYNTRKWYSNYSESYIVGYGKGGAALQQFAMLHPTAFIAGGFVDAADGISSEFMSANAKEVNDEQTEIRRGSIPMPVWEVGGNDDVVNYWLAANHCTGKSEEKNGDSVYTQTEECQQTSYTRGVTSKVIVSDKKEGAVPADYTDSFIDFMTQYTKYENKWAEGNALMLRPDYEKMGVKFVPFNQDGYAREYLVYVPKSAPAKDIPVVYVMAGNTQTPRVFFDCTDWWQVADDYGFMVVMPSEQFNTAVDLTWNITGYQQGSDTATADDAAFLKSIMKEVSANYPIDASRQYMTGQSFGSMWTNWCALYNDEPFAAFGSTSGLISFEIDDSAGKTLVPVWQYCGEHDIYKSDYTVDATEGFNLKATVEYFLKRNGLGGIGDETITKDDRYTTSTWKDANGVPMYVLTVTGGRNHNCIPAEPRMIWEKWFSKWSKDANGKRVYRE